MTTDQFELYALDGDFAVEELPQGNALGTLSSTTTAACAACPSTVSSVACVGCLG
ncbi:thiocillin family RiPP [Sphaerisporangium album]|uniref:Thiocillin family RiPP n=1 Tax=Sphaerisporangium album TaxID=509200 RepID=A0A367FJW8_9ACTN|nr:thiocillin family RiPP [Sphaerisporangium album]RCG30551.1 thiocillin family RiPP [Sphaerisporangium album]